MRLSPYIFDIVDTFLQETSPRRVAFGVVVGLLLATSPLLSVQTCLLLFVVVVGRPNILSFFFSYVAARSLIWLARDDVRALGLRILIGHPVRTTFFAWAYQAPIVPFTSFNHSLVMGSLFLVGIALIPVYFTVTILTRRLSPRLGPWIERSRFQTAWMRTSLFQRNQARRNRHRNLPIRLIALPPLGLLALVLIVYLNFIFDLQLRDWVARQASVYNSAVVDIRDLTTHIFSGTVDVRGIAFSDPVRGSENLLEIDHLHFKFDPILALRKKIIIKEMRIEGVEYRSKRLTSGTLPSDLSIYGLPAVLDRTSNELIPQLIVRTGNNPFSHLNLLSEEANLETTVSQLHEELVSKGKIEELHEELVAGVGADANEDDREPSSVPKLSRADLDKIHTSIDSLGQLVTSDVNRIWDRLGLRALDQDDLTNYLFGGKLLSYIERISYWDGISRRRMPGGSRHGEITWTIVQRENGESVHFGRTGGSPAFMVEHAEINSTPKAGTERGRVSGTIRNISSDPSICNCVTTINLDADFPAHGVDDVKLSVLIDHRTEDYHESFVLSVGTFLLHDWNILESGDLTVGLANGTGHLNLESHFTSGGLKILGKLDVRDASFTVRSTFHEVTDSIQNALNSAPQFTLLAQTAGAFDALKLDTSSEVGQRLAESLRRDFRYRLAGVKDNIRHIVEEQIEPSRSELLSAFNEAGRHVPNR